MTKKFIHTDKAINGESAKNEFLILDIYDDTTNLIGLKTLNSYQFGKIVFTGVELDVNEVFKRANNKRKISLLKRSKAKAKIGKYLEQIKNLKIGDTIHIDIHGNLRKIDLKQKYFKRNWDEARIENGENWGKSNWLIETDYQGYPERQIEIYENGKRLKYSINMKEDKYGGLGDQALDFSEFEPYKIHKNEFEKEWKKDASNV